MIANYLKTTLDNVQRATGISIPEHKVAQMMRLIESNSDEAARLMLSHSTPDWRSPGSAQHILRERARYYASINPNAKPTFIPVFQADSEDPVFSVTTCGNCDSLLLGTIALTFSTYASAAIVPLAAGGAVVCPACAGAAFILGVIAAELADLLLFR